MHRPALLFSIILSLILVACAPQALPAPNQSPGVAGASQVPTSPVAAPAETSAAPQATHSPEQTEVSMPTQPAPFAPQPEDKQLKRGAAFVTSAEVIVQENDPLQYQIQIKGNLPTPCHNLRVKIGQPNEQHRIPIEVYSVVQPGLVCPQVLDPFTANIPLGELPEADYTVEIPDTIYQDGRSMPPRDQFPGTPEPMTQVTPQEPGDHTDFLYSPAFEAYAPRPGDKSLQQGNAFVDEARVQISESTPPRLNVSLQGNLPTPCHQLRVDVSGPDAQQEIHLKVYSVVNPQQMCAQVLQPFQINLPFQLIESGPYRVFVNGELAGEATQ